jgi:hypothetical protein
MPTAWGYCDPCQRWFYPDTTRPSASMACPVCASEATAVRDRPEAAGAG